MAEPGKHVVLPVSSALAIVNAETYLTVDEMRQRLLAIIDSHPEMPTGIALELWPDGRMVGKLGGGGLAPKGIVTTIEHPNNESRSLIS